MKRIALIDGDVLVYRAGFAAEVNTDWGDGTHSVNANETNGIEIMDYLISNILSDLKTQHYHVALTCHQTVNFRKGFFPLYKENRKKMRKPLLWEFLRTYLVENYDAQVRDTLEADDVLGIWATKEWSKNPERVIVSVDKDFKSVPCNYWNMTSKKMVKIDEATADYNHMLQTLVGDSTDNYPGCQGIGPKKAATILTNARSQNASMWRAVLLAFRKAGFGEDFALSQARCARILRACDYNFDTKQPILWRPTEDEQAKQSKGG